MIRKYHGEYHFTGFNQLELQLFRKAPSDFEQTAHSPAPVEDSNIQYPGKPGHREHAKDTLAHQHHEAREELLQTGVIDPLKHSPREESDYQASKI